MTDIADLVARAREGQARAIGRLLSLVEDGSAALPEAMAALGTGVGGAHVVGITGPPGVGKSTMTSALVAAFRERGDRVGVIAVDPSSPFSGGALLGDRIRMHEHATDPDVFIRSMASRGHLGGLAVTTPQAVRVLDAAGFDTVLVETVGVGQSEVEIAAAADTTVVLLAPGMGDGIQAAKAGVLEIADLLVVNKADRDGAATTARELAQAAAMGESSRDGWSTPVVTAIAARGEVADVVAGLDAHRSWLRTSGGDVLRRQRRAAAEINAMAMAAIHDRLTGEAADVLEGLARGVVEGGIDPFAAVEQLLSTLGLRLDGPNRGMPG